MLENPSAALQTEGMHKQDMLVLVASSTFATSYRGRPGGNHIGTGHHA